MTLTVGSLCAGIGGLDLGLGMVADTELAWVSEIEDAPSQILARHFPGVPNLGDLTVLDWHDVPPVDVLTAGFPCPPVSHAGLRKGTDDDRWIWPHIADAVRVLRPGWVFIENVDGLRSLGMGGVLRDLAQARYDVRWTGLRASEGGAAHGRPRVFILAAAEDANGESGFQRWQPASGQAPGGGAWADAGRRAGAPAADADSAGLEGREPAAGRVVPAGGGAEPAADTEGERRGERRPEHAGPQGGSDAAFGPRAAHREDSSCCGRTWLLEREGEAIDFGPAVRRWERVTRVSPPCPLNARGRQSPEFTEWLMGYPIGWTDVLPAEWSESKRRNARIKALGNAVVPAQAAAAVLDLLSMNLPRAVEAA